MSSDWGLGCVPLTHLCRRCFSRTTGSLYQKADASAWQAQACGERCQKRAPLFPGAEAT